MRIVKTFFVSASILLVGMMMSCNKVETLPLPTLVPTAQIPPTSPTAQTVETPLAQTESASADNSTAPDQDNIVFFNADGEGLFFTNPAGSETVQLFDLQNISQILAASPDGKWLTFRNGGQLYNARTDGSAINEIVGADTVSVVSWDPDSNHLAFILDGDIFILSVAGGKLERLTNGLGLSDLIGRLSWSPDSRQLLFACDANASDICLIASQGGGTAVNLTNNSDTTLYRELTWSPDGNQISFVSPDQEGNLQIYTMKADGTDLTQLTSIGENTLHSWSPDGSRIVYTTVLDGRWQANMMNSDGSGTLQLSEGIPPEANSIYPSWSPDGNFIRLLFTLPTAPDEFSIAVWDLEDSQLAIFPDRTYWANWSPDGTQIAYLYSNSQIRIANSDGSGSVGLINCLAGCEFFVWLP